MGYNFTYIRDRSTFYQFNTWLKLVIYAVHALVESETYGIFLHSIVQQRENLRRSRQHPSAHARHKLLQVSGAQVKDIAKPSGYGGSDTHNILDDVV